jgi:hypothetical protein
LDTRQRESIKSPINVRLSPSSAVECYPCREVPLNYSESLLFHGGDTGSTPVRDAKILKSLQNPTISPRVQKSPLTKSLPYESLGEASSGPCSALLTFRTSLRVRVHCDLEIGRMQEFLNDFGILSIGIQDGGSVVHPHLD